MNVYLRWKIEILYFSLTNSKNETSKENLIVSVCTRRYSVAFYDEPTVNGRKNQKHIFFCIATVNLKRETVFSRDGKSFIVILGFTLPKIVSQFLFIYFESEWVATELLSMVSQQ